MRGNKKKIFKLSSKTKGQALLIVIVISTLALLLLLAMADRIILSRVNIQRNEEFDRSIAIAENGVNEIIKILDGNPVVTAQCLNRVNTAGNSAQYQLLDCPELSGQNAQIYARLIRNGSIGVGPDTPLTHFIGTSAATGIPTSGIVITCETGHSGERFVVTRVYTVNNIFYSDKGVFTCNNNAAGSNAIGNVALVSALPSENAQVAGPGITNPVTRANTIMIRIRPYLEGQRTIDLNINTYNASGGLVSGIDKYEFLVTGFADLGSDSAVLFERPAANNSSFAPEIFDYVYMGEN